MSLAQKPRKQSKYVVCDFVYFLCEDKISRRLVRDPIVAVASHSMRLVGDAIEAAYSESKGQESKNMERQTQEDRAL